MFEAGAIWKASEDTFVTSIPVGVSAEEIERTPLAQFQNTLFEESEIWSLIQSCRDALGANTPDDVMREHFELAWHSLVKEVQAVEFASSGESLKEPTNSEIVNRLKALEEYLVDRETEREKELNRILSTVRKVRKNITTDEMIRESLEYNDWLLGPKPSNAFAAENLNDISLSMREIKEKLNALAFSTDEEKE